MTRIAAGFLLVLGIVIATGSGARLSDEHAAHRRATAAGQASLGAPDPQQRLTLWAAQSGVGWGVGVALILAGALWLRQQSQAALATGDGAEGVDFLASLATVDQTIGRLQEALADVPMDDTADAVRDDLDRLSVDVLGPVVAARGRWMAAHGVGAFASYFSPFSAGERQLHRAWSALADGHVVVARAALTDATRSFRDAAQAYKDVAQPA